MGQNTVMGNQARCCTELFIYGVISWHHSTLCCHCCAGAELTDATEAVALAADECTIAAGCIGDLLAAQVPLHFSSAQCHSLPCRFLQHCTFTLSCPFLSDMAPGLMARVAIRCFLSSYSRPAPTMLSSGCIIRHRLIMYHTWMLHG